MKDSPNETYLIQKNGLNSSTLILKNGRGVIVKTKNDENSFEIQKGSLSVSYEVKPPIENEIVVYKLGTVIFITFKN